MVDLTLDILQELTNHLKDVGDCAPKNNMKPMLGVFSEKVLGCKDMTISFKMWMVIDNLLGVCDDSEMALNYIDYLYKHKDQFKGKSEFNRGQTSGIFAAISACLRVFTGRCPH